MLAKSEIVAKYQCSPEDTGSPEVQVALLSSDIERLNKHFQKHKNDKHSKQGLLKKVASRRKLIQYLESDNSKRHLSLIKQLGLRG